MTSPLAVILCFVAVLSALTAPWWAWAILGAATVLELWAAALTLDSTD